MKAEAVVFKKRQFLEEQSFRLKQEEKLLTLETEIAKSQAREQALASMVDSNPRVVFPSSVSMDPNQRSVAVDPVKVDRIRRLINQSGALSLPSERAFHEMLELHQHQNALQRQQNKIVEMLATQQKKSSLPYPKVPIFDGSPMEYSPFI